MLYRGHTLLVILSEKKLLEKFRERIAKKTKKKQKKIKKSLEIKK